MLGNPNNFKKVGSLRIEAKWKKRIYLGIIKTKISLEQRKNYRNESRTVSAGDTHLSCQTTIIVTLEY